MYTQLEYLDPKTQSALVRGQTARLEVTKVNDLTFLVQSESDRATKYQVSFLERGQRDFYMCDCPARAMCKHAALAAAAFYGYLEVRSARAVEKYSCDHCTRRASWLSNANEPMCNAHIRLFNYLNAVTID